jgi:hypothetical protein
MKHILATHEAEYFLKNEQIPDESQIVWKCLVGDSWYTLHMGRTEDGESVLFFIGTPDASLKGPTVHRL